METMETQKTKTKKSDSVIWTLSIKAPNTEKGRRYIDGLKTIVSDSRVWQQEVETESIILLVGELMWNIDDTLKFLENAEETDD